MDIKLYRCFNADQRVSMQIYADQLEQELNSPNFRVTSHQPESRWERYSHHSAVMRYLRYVKYPYSLSSVNANIHHVTDHGYAHLLPQLGKGRSVVTVHDLIPLLAHKGVIESNSRLHRPRLNEYSLSFVKKFDHVVTPSESTANDLKHYFNLPDHKISVIAPMIGGVFSPKSTAVVDAFASRHGLSEDPYWVLISGQEFYKNHQTSLKVIKELRSRGMNVQVLKTGVTTTEFNTKVAEFDLEQVVHQVFLQNVAEVAEAYAFVDCLLFPSYYEGFGMPVIEALACGTRVVASDRGSLPEISGDIVQCVDPNDIDSLSQELSRQLELSRIKSKLFIDQAQNSIKKFRPKVLVPVWHRVYRSLSG